MKLYIRMPSRLKPYFKQELHQAKFVFAHDLAKSWHHLERAHIIGQPYPVAHTLVHWKMLKFGVRVKSYKEILGQFPRLLLGGIKSFVGKIPVGNTGGANVHPLKPMPIPEDLNYLINAPNSDPAGG